MKYAYINKDDTICLQQSIFFRENDNVQQGLFTLLFH